jgi:hydrogenase expression/formation protein HypD
VELAQKIDNDVVFMAAGFETTELTQQNSFDPPENFSVLTCHRIIPPALDYS